MRPETKAKPTARPKEPEHTTPGRPNESSSRQQHHPDQGLDSGSKPLDRDSTDGTAGGAAKP